MIAAQDELGVLFFLHPAERRDGVAVHGEDGIVILAGGHVAAGQRAHFSRGRPLRDAVGVRPGADGAVTRRVFDLIDVLRPLAGALGRGHRTHLPGVAADEREDAGGLVLPVLAPVLRDDRLAAHLHDEDVLEADEVATVFDEADDLVSA